MSRKAIGLQAPTGILRRPRSRGKAPSIGKWFSALDLVRVGIYAQIVIDISGVQMFIGSLNSMRPGLIALALAVSGIALRPQEASWHALRQSWVPKAVGFLLFLACGSVFFGIAAGGSANYILSYYWKTLFFYLLLVIGVRTTRDLALFFWAFVISIGILVFLAVGVLDVNVTDTGLGRVAGTGMYDANDLGMLFLMGLPLALLFSFNAKGVGRWIARALLVGIPFGVALTGSRGAMLGLVALAPIIFFSLKRIGLGRRVTAIAVVVVSLFVAAPAGYWDQMSTILDAGEDYNVTSDYGRVALAKRGVGYMLSHPFFGVGIGNFRMAEGTLSPLAIEALSRGDAAQWWAPHNTYVEVGAELGVFALATWLTLLIGGSIGLWRLRSRIPARWESETSERRFLREACLFLPGSFVAFAVASFFLSHAYTAPMYIFAAFLTSVHVLVRRELRRDAAVAHARIRSHPSATMRS